MDAEVAAAEVSSAVNLVIQVTRRAGKRFVSEIAVIDPSMLHGALVSPETVFTGNLREVDGVLTTEFTRRGGVRADSELGLKLEDAGLLERWGVE
jgi:hypothetical protein